MNQRFTYFLWLIFIPALSFAAIVPQEINYQGFVAVDNVPFDGTGLFKFAIVDSTGTTTYWSNDGTSTNGEEPISAVSLQVNQGQFSVALGNTTYPNMTSPLASEVFASGDTKLRIWFDGGSGFQRLVPDQPFDSVPYTIQAGVVDKIEFPPIEQSGVNPPSLLPRESVWPEHEGRTDNVVSQTFVFIGSSAISDSTFAVPLNRRFIITDLELNVPSGTGTFRFFYKLGSDEKTLLYTQVTGRKTLEFQAGVPVPPDGTLQAEYNGVVGTHYVEVTGFEYPY